MIPTQISDNNSSEITFPVDHSFQVDASVWRHDPGLGREMGVEFIMVLPQSVWSAVSVWIHFGKRQL